MITSLDEEKAHTLEGKELQVVRKRGEIGYA